MYGQAGARQGRLRVEERVFTSIVELRPAELRAIASRDSAGVPLEGLLRTRQGFETSRPPDFHLRGARPKEVARRQPTGRGTA
jgi:hypothetical protein